MVGDVWKDLRDWGEKAWTGGPRQLADPTDLNIPTCVDTVDEAVAIVRENMELWLGHPPV